MTIRSEARLPHGYRVIFTWSDQGQLGCEWLPDVPRIVQPRQQRKFLAAYERQRDAFLEEVARCIGGPIIVSDMQGNARTIEPVERRMAG